MWYEERGTGQPLVLIHGGWSDADVWEPQVRAFADDYRVITYDIRGHGRTGPTETRPYSIDLFVDDLERLLSHCGVTDPLLCGFSLGGMVAQAYLRKHPDSARGAVISGPIQSMPPVALPSAVKPFVSPKPMISSLASSVGTTATFETLLNSIEATTGQQWLSVDPDVRSQALEAAGEVAADEYGKIFTAMYRFDPADMSHVETPVRVLYGDHEAPSVKRQGQQLAGSVADGGWQEIPESGHTVNQDRPAAFNATVAEFFPRCDSPTPAT
jgi:pimeloyl-ACP methyl ester carboxylesterase